MSVGLREPYVWPSESFFSETELLGRPW
jgi:hypothetical protein